MSQPEPPRHPPAPTMPGGPPANGWRHPIRGFQTRGLPARRLPALVVALALLGSACVNGDDGAGPAPGSDPDTSTPATDGDTNATTGPVDPASAVFAEGACGFEGPTGTDPRCGTVTVPENWATGAGTVELAVAVYPTTADSPAPDPVIYLEGGPGGHSLDTVRFVSADLLEPLQARGDVIFFDQRGAGRSTPRLDCEEVTTLSRELEDVPSTPDAEVDARFADSLRACRSRLEGRGIDVGAYTTLNNAHDVEAIRAALGYDAWNLYGISYGTKLALEVLRQHPAAVRSVVIDSVFPPEVDSTRDNPGTFVESYRAVVEACAQEAACAAAGDLGERFRAVVAAYDAEPLQVEVQDFLAGTTDEVWVNGESIIGVVTQALYSPGQFSDLPELVAELEQARTGALEAYLSQQRTNEPFFSTGMFYAFECNEEIPFANPAEVRAAVPDDPFGRRDTFDYASNNGPSAFSTCEAFGTGVPDRSADEPVTSDIPTLVMAGRFDPVTPVAWAELAAANLSNSHLVVAPRGSHGVSPGSCGMGVVRRFLDAPGDTPDAGCFDDEELRFLTPPDPSDVELEEITFASVDPSLTITTVRPRDWVHTDLDGDSLRQASFLDPTEIIQLAGDAALLANLEFFLGNSLGLPLSEPVSVDRADRDWRYRSGGDGSTAVEWYEAEINDHTAVVILVSSVDDLEANIAAVLDPALDNIDVTG